MNIYDMACACRSESLGSYINVLLDDLYHYNIVIENLMTQIQIFITVLCDKDLKIKLLECELIPMDKENTKVIIILTMEDKLSEEQLQNFCNILKVECYRYSKDDNMYYFLYEIKGDNDV